MSDLLLPVACRQAIAAHLQQCYPQEGCGLLLGKDRQVEQVWPAANVWQPDTAEENHDRRDRYQVDPQALLQAQRYCRDRQWQILGIYHSHPDHPALPSECDRLQAWPEYVYLIASVTQGKIKDCRCWQLNDQQQFQAIAIAEPT
ncbi:M67 family metallopeptidase [Synechococcus elongatus]|uniref:M67 family metallopeptidase n=1 Tax=Synechococcus elongatus PCC 11802 TaxID=2283154 RepID=A0AAT9JY59_SYNEL|nr:M67 family metallopeptidase [Synechococcus elongatus]QFZ91468.1 M67 family peptidase [Synechococcus elongatus PCC 11802]